MQTLACDCLAIPLLIGIPWLEDKVTASKVRRACKQAVCEDDEGMSRASHLIEKLLSCPVGTAGWKAYENVVVEILCYLFVPPLVAPRVQARSHSGIDRRDAVFANRNPDPSSNWGLLLRELNARMIVVEIKNPHVTDIGKTEVDQTFLYMRKPMGNLAMIVCSKRPSESARIRRNTIFSEFGKVILFVTNGDLKKMLLMKERGEDPANRIVYLLELFYTQAE